MQIAVLGSWSSSDVGEWGLVDHSGFITAARAIGAVIVGNGHSLIVGGDSQNTADFHAVNGALAALGASCTNPRIQVIAARDRGPQFQELRRKTPGLFTEQFVPADNWAAVKAFQTREADGLVILGGAHGALQAGLTAAVCGKRLVCVGSFGGAAKRLNELFMISRQSWGHSIPDRSELGLFQNPWSEFLLNRIPPCLRIDNRPRILIIHGRSDDRYELKNYLQNSHGLPEPIIMAERILPGELLPAKFEQLASEVDAAIALGTPDDFGGLNASGDSRETTEMRARQNVWLEVGWFWGRLGRGRVLILSRGDVAFPSDLSGIEAYKYSGRPSDRVLEIQSFVRRVSSGIRG